MRHFWIVDGDDSRVWSSEAAAYVPMPAGMFPTVADALDAGNLSTELVDVVPTRIASEEELWAVLRDHFPDGLPAEQRSPRLVPKRIIIDRLQAAGLLEEAKAAIDAADLYTQERWNTRTDIYANDQTAHDICRAIGADPDVIFAA